MADRMYVFPARTPVAVEPSTTPVPSASQAPSAPRRYRGLQLVKGLRAGSLADAAMSQRREWRTQEIVAQVEREIAAMATRRALQMIRSASATAAAGDSVRRDTPWIVLRRVLRAVRASERRSR